MSEPTSGDRQHPDPDNGREPDGNRDEVDEVQDVTPDPFFSDPTAPVWADPTAPIPTEPPPPPPPPTPPGAHPESDQPGAGPASPQATPPVAPPVSNPYAQQPPTEPYGQQQPPAQPYGQQQPPAQPYGQPQPPAQPYGQLQPGQQYPAYGQQPYPTGPQPETNSSALVLTILSGVSLVFCNILAIASLIFGILALTRNSTDPAGSRRLTKTGWIVFAVIWALAVLGIIAYIVFVVALVGNSGSDFNY